MFSINHALKTGIYEECRPSSGTEGAPYTCFHTTMPSWWEAFATWKHVGQQVPKEYKPTLKAVALDVAILAYPARCRKPMVQPIFVFVDDFHNFSQLPIASEELWKSIVAGFSTQHLADSSPPRIQFVAEYRLGFGIAINSNVCQRLANFILHVFMQQFRHEESLLQPEEAPCVQNWLRTRRKLGETTGRWEDTLFCAHIYTDDPIFMVIGVQRTLRALRL